VSRTILACCAGVTPSARRWGPSWIGAAVLSLLAAAAEAMPILCVVDDAHWLDEPSADALTFAARRLHAERIAMLFAARSGDARTFPAPGLPELRLEGLDPEASRALLREHADPALTGEVRERLVHETGTSLPAQSTL